MTLPRPDHTTRSDAVFAERHLIVDDYPTSNGLNHAGIPAMTYGDLLRDSDAGNMVRLGGKVAVLVVTARTVDAADAAQHRLRRLGLPFFVVRELLDESGR